MTTIEELARMIHEGFKSTATKEDVTQLRNEMTELRGEMKTRFDKIEKLILEDHKRRIENLEKELKELKSLLAV